MKAGELRPVDMKLLRATLASNGGGVNVNVGYSEATRTRLMKAGLIQWKPNDKSTFASLVTITPAGKAHLAKVDPAGKVCPDLPKGQRCPLCGGAYVCLRSSLPKVGTTGAK